jgi:hypothetical protein
VDLITKIYYQIYEQRVDKSLVLLSKLYRLYEAFIAFAAAVVAQVIISASERAVMDERG